MSTTRQPYATKVKHQIVWRILSWVDGVLDEFSGWFCGKPSPVHLFWHSFDLALTRFSGRRAPAAEGADAVSREAYSQGPPCQHDRPPTASCRGIVEQLGRPEDGQGFPWNAIAYGFRDH